MQTAFGQKKGAGVPDFVLLSEVSEEAFMKNLADRYNNDDIYTYIGDVVVAMNPYKKINMYTEKDVQDYKGRYMYECQPHIFALADDAYRSMMHNKDNQCIIISGESGAGKTESSKIIMQYIAAITPASQKGSVSHIKDKLLESNPVLEAFGNAKTLRNDNSSRFGKYMEIQFDMTGAPVGGRITNYLLEKSRIVRRQEGERSFHIFYQLLKGADDALIKTLGLQRDANAYPYLASSNCVDVPGMDDAMEFKQVLKSLKVLGVSDEDQEHLWKLVATILHISSLQFAEGQSEVVGQIKTDIKNMEVVKIVADLLSVDVDKLKSAMTSRTLKTAGQLVNSPLDLEKSKYARDALAKALYQKLFDWLVIRLNRGIEYQKVGKEDLVTIGILDIYGFEVFQDNGFEQFCINYCNESLQQLFIELTLKAEQEEYVREGIEWEPVKFFNNQIIVDLIEHKQGIIATLDDVCMIDSSATDPNFLAKLNSNFMAHDHYESYEKNKDRSIPNDSFRLKHYAGNVIYRVEGFVDKNRDTLFRDIIEIFCTSADVLVQELFPKSLMIDADNNKRPVTTSTQFKKAVNDLMLSLRACSPHYVRCIKPNGKKKANLFDDELCRHQVRYLGLLENVRVRRAGFANRQTYERFLQRYKMCSKKTWPTWKKAPADGVREIITENKTDQEKECRFGKTKLFIRNPETLFFYEELRDKRMPYIATLMQKVFRGYKGRVRVRRMKAALQLQLRFKGLQARIWIERVKHAVVIQTHIRALQARILYRRSQGALRLETIYRAWKYRREWTRKKSATRIQRKWRKWVAQRYIKALQATFAEAPKDKLFGKYFKWAKPPPGPMRESEAMLKREYKKFWVMKMVKSLTAPEQVKMRQKILTSDIFKGKKPWAVPRRFTADYLGSDSNPTRPQFQAALGMPPLNNPKIMFSTAGIKVNPGGSPQPRGILVTDQGLFKLDPKAYKVKKEMTPIADVAGVTVSTKGDSWIVVHVNAPRRDLLLEIARGDDGERVSEFVVVLFELLKKSGKTLDVKFNDTFTFNNRRPKPNNVTATFRQDPKVPAPTYKKMGPDQGAILMPTGGPA
eukprot:TRINITY_DN1068_c0_g1_i1.p1 TRINITY_DN1068_c0_g1~~TRINITY_DN1068_c0_g1_i1.p1  ORF type:complete len:1087 (-),score=316.36 TRINITY_DN1068_c0_g1_i1:32-3268(-)